MLCVVFSPPRLEWQVGRTQDGAQPATPLPAVALGMEGRVLETCPHDCPRDCVPTSHCPSMPVPQLTLSLFSGSTSIIPRSRLWQSGGMKWGMWKTPRFTFSSSWRRLSSSKGRAPCMRNDGTPYTQSSACTRRVPKRFTCSDTVRPHHKPWERGSWGCLHFTDGETEAWRHPAICTRPSGSEVAEQ